ncbi:hypothetical protein [Bacillus wiedmannii]
MIDEQLKYHDFILQRKKPRIGLYDFLHTALTTFSKKDEAKHLIPEIEKISGNVIKGTITNIPKGDIQTTMFVLQHMIENLKTK